MNCVNLGGARQLMHRDMITHVKLTALISGWTGFQKQLAFVHGYSEAMFIHQISCFKVRAVTGAYRSISLLLLTRLLARRSKRPNNWARQIVSVLDHSSVLHINLHKQPHLIQYLSGLSCVCNTDRRLNVLKEEIHPKTDFFIVIVILDSEVTCTKEDICIPELQIILWGHQNILLVGGS